MNNLKKKLYTKKKIGFINWNIETPFYCNIKKHPKNEQKFLDNNKRYEKIVERINKEISEENIICLQEVCRSWACKLQILFKERSYTFISSLYGHKRNGYMGISIAFPNKYILVDQKIERLSEIIHLPNKNSNVGYFQFLWDILGYKNDEDIMDIARSRKNTIIGLKLKLKKDLEGNDHSPFWVFNFHMPCLWRTPFIMAIYCVVLQKFLKDVTNNGEIPFVLLGDFNSQPMSVQYEILTEGSIDSMRGILNEYPKFINDEKYLELKSVYKEFHGVEPMCTNFSYCDFSGEFKGTLDYIFISDDISIDKVDTIEEPESYMPNEWPSDHYLIKAKLII